MIGIDVGTTGVKTIAISPNGEVIAQVVVASRARVTEVSGKTALDVPGAGDQAAGALGVCQRFRELYPALHGR